MDAEHGTEEHDADGLEDIAIMAEHINLMAEAVDTIGASLAELDLTGRRLIDDTSVRYRFGRGIARMEAAMSTTGMFGRVAIAQTMRDTVPDLMDILGTASSLTPGTDGAAADGSAEYLYRLAGPTGIYGGTMEVFRNMIAQHALGFSRPNYSALKR